LRSQARAVLNCDRPRPEEALERADAGGDAALLLAARQRDNSFRDKLGRYTERDRHDADLRRKAMTALTAKMARVVHAVIKGGAEYRPFFERPVPGGRTSPC
jgi:hypothetical protein